MALVCSYQKAWVLQLFRRLCRSARSSRLGHARFARQTSSQGLRVHAMLWVAIWSGRCTVLMHSACPQH